MSTQNPDARPITEEEQALHDRLLNLQSAVLENQQASRALAENLVESGDSEGAQAVMDDATAVAAEFREVVEAADAYFGSAVTTDDGEPVDGDGSQVDISANAQGQGLGELRIGPLGSTSGKARRVTTESGSGGGGGNDPSAGTMRDYRERQGDVSANRADDSASVGTMADYREKQAKSDARPVRIVDDGDLQGNSLTAHKEREQAETIHVVGTADGSGNFRTNVAGMGSGTFGSLATNAERVRITDEPGADPVILSHVNTTAAGGPMADYRARRNSKDVVVVNPERLPSGAI